MKRFLSLAMALCVAVTLSLDVQAAKRFGGGKSMGSAPSHQTRQVQPSTAPNTPSTPNTAAPAAGAAAGAAAAGGASRWLGPLAGIAAGGLLASLFMGGGFQGMQFLDILIIALIAFIAFRFIAARRRQQARPLAAGHPAPMQRDMPAAAPIFGGSAQPAARAPLNAPSWFDEQRFIGAAREHFLALQQHWDANEMDKIGEFVTPQMLQWLKQERADLGDGYQSTYIDNLQVQLDGIDDQADKTIATLTFSGVSKSSRFDQGEAFSESWRMERAQGQNQPWLLAGIRQNG
ncbi:Tim44 domain-containing protein [Pseudomonas panipatensis]|uniref:Predicted lipid-binding transport protein, Tim44 family n=1 Tax=Pseudomonas panipatensis TaxID=428992 RepID=A0A1G8M330_9PSED|nr:Tim44 domain-containing protein [Pseudomonas panipatensis]SDI62187.1 Predicted lipid-binding transport protein, Tim44 family [Pseudomonas panipatensis]SMP48086.1 Predicted lipid-binding transport protein, Tim44 family [Pseudomonas panipatensis]